MPQMENGFAQVIKQLVQEIDGLRNSIGPLMHSASFNARFNSFLMSRFLDENGELVANGDDGEQTYRVGPQDFGKLRRIERRVVSANVAQALLPSSLLVTLVSRYDAFLGRLIRAMVVTRPELLKSSERSLTLSNLLELGDYDAAREYLIEKEIEAVLRRSHAEHFDWLESRLEMPLRKDLPSWKAFIELTERRNLLVHCDGIVSHQYVANCEQHDVELEQRRVGDKLDAPSQYYRDACDCISEMAVKLTHVVWRKLLPNDRESADNSLNDTCFEFILHEHYQLAHELLRFSSDVLKKHATERHRLMYLVNWAQVCKWLGNHDECRKLLKNEDWSAKGQDFQICVAVLLEEYERAVQIMKSIGRDGIITAEAYRDWPMFRLARKEQSFLDGYRETFGEDMKIGENVVPVSKEQLREFLETLTTNRLNESNSHDTGDESDIDIMNGAAVREQNANLDRNEMDSERPADIGSNGTN